MAITQKYDLNLVPRDVPVVVQCSQYDKSSRRIIFTMYKDEELYTIPSGVAITVRGTKRDKTGFVYSCSYAAHTITMVIEEQMTVFNGNVPCELRITQGTQVLGTANFTLYVEKSPLDDDTIISETDIPLLQQAVEAYGIASAALDEVQGMSDDVQEAYDMAVAAKAAADAITVDTALSTTSTNPVQNKAITTELNTMKDDITTNADEIENTKNMFTWKSLGKKEGVTSDWTVTIPTGVTPKEIEVVVAIGSYGETGTGIYLTHTVLWQNFQVPLVFGYMFSTNYYASAGIKIDTPSRTVTVLPAWIKSVYGSTTLRGENATVWLSYR